MRTLDPNNNPENKDIYPDKYDGDDTIIYYDTEDKQQVYVKGEDDA